MSALAPLVFMVGAGFMYLGMFSPQYTARMVFVGLILTSVGLAFLER